MKMRPYSTNPRNFVARYGADPSGRRDCGPALQDAMDDQQRGGDTLFVPPGTYLLESETAQNGTGYSIKVAGVGPSSKFLVQMPEYYDAITINSTPSGCRPEFTDLSFVGRIVVDPMNPDLVPQCGRAIVLAGTLGSPTLRRVSFAGMYVKGAVAYLGNGAIGALVDDCDFVGCTALGTINYDVQSLLEFNIIFGAKVRNSRFTSLGAFADQQFNTNVACRQAIRFRHFDVNEGGGIDGSQGIVEGCSFYNVGGYMISTLEPTGTPNGPTSPIYPPGVSRAYGFVIPPNFGLWNRPTGTASGGYPLQYTFQIRIDVGGPRGVAEWSTRFQDAGFGGGFTDWVSHGAVTSAVVNGMTFSMALSTPDFVDGQIYQCYVLGDTGGMRQIAIDKCTGVSVAGIIMSEVDDLLITQLDFNSGGPTTAVDLYGVKNARIIQPQIRANKILAEQAGFGYAANGRVYVEDPNADAILQLKYATIGESRRSGVLYRHRVADGTVAANTLGKASTTTGRVAQFLAADAASPELITCAIADAGADGAEVRCVEQAGQQVTLLNDAAGAVATGGGVDPSSSIDGRVRAGAGLLGYNAGDAAAASGDPVTPILKIPGP